MARESLHPYDATLVEQMSTRDRLGFPSTRVEREVLSAIDHRLNVYYWKVEAHLLEQARAFNRKAAELRGHAEAITEELRDMEFALDAGKDIDLDRWLVLDSQAAGFDEQMDSLKRQFLGHYQRLTDVVAYVDHLQRTYPGLNRPMVLPPPQR